mgnify:CR=1 FL=1
MIEFTTKTSGRHIGRMIFCSGLLLALMVLQPARAQDTTITYQGQLRQTGEPFTGTANLEFRLFDQLAAGIDVAPPQTRLNWPVEDGLFQVELDFGGAAFDGSERYLEVRVNGAPLSPRQHVTATPYALLAAGTAGGAIGGIEIDPSEVQLRVTGTCPAGQAIRQVNQNGTVTCETDNDSGGDITSVTAGTGLSGGGASGAVSLALDTGFTDGLYWRQGGNAGTNPASNFLGTSDAQPLEFRTNNARSLRIEPSAATFGAPALPITTNMIGGSHANEVTAGVRGATIAGGGVPAGDSDPDFGVAEFPENPNRVTDHYGSIGGGYGNQAGDNAGTASGSSFATVGGGGNNTASGAISTVGGGVVNTASGNWSTIGGGSVNTASDSWSTISGGQANTASDVFSTIGGGTFNTASGGQSAVGGGQDNTASGSGSTVGGGWSNTASGGGSTVGGGLFNCAGGADSWAGGYLAKVRPGTGSGAAGNGCNGVPSSGDVDGDEGSFVWADSQGSDFVSSGPNQFLIRADGGLMLNTSTLPGFADDVVFKARPQSGDADIDLRLVTRGDKQVSVFVRDSAGTLAISPQSLTSGSNRLEVFGGTGGDASLSYGGTWTNASSRAYKTGFATIDPADVLARVVDLPITTWSYRESTEGRHMGPMAEDFHAAFGLANDDKSIATVDADGVALAAIQGLAAENVELRRQSTALQKESSALQEENHALVERLSEVESRHDAELAELESRNGELEASLAELETRNGELEASLAAVESRHDAELAELRNQQNDELTSLRSELALLRELMAPRLAAAGER